MLDAGEGLVMAESLLVRTLKSKEKSIIDEWVKIAHASSARYASRPIEELRKNITEVFHGVVEAADTGDYSRIFDTFRKIAQTRSKQGFQMSETIRIVTMGTRLMMAEIKAQQESASLDDIAEAFDKLVEMMNWIIVSFTDSFEDVREKEFVAGTLVGLSSAQDELDEPTILRRSLEECRRMFGFEEGAVLMRYHQEFSTVSPPEALLDADLYKSTAEKVSATVEPLVVDVETFNRQSGRRPPPNATIRTLVGIPIMARGKILGTILLGSPLKRSVSSHEMRFFTAVTSQIGLACDNARLLGNTKRYIERMKAGQAEAFTILSELDAAVYVSDMETYEILAVNRYIENLFGKDLVGKKCYESFQRSTGEPCSFCTNPQLVKNGSPAGPYVWKFKNTVTGRWFNCIDRAIRWPDGRLVRMEVAFDITELENARAELEDARAMLELYNDLLVHDVGNYVGVVRTYLQILEQDFGESEKASSIINTALAQTVSCMNLVDSVSRLMLARSLKEDLVRTDIGSVLDEAVVDVHEMEKEHAGNIVKHYSTGIHFANLGALSKEIFVNILSNAVRYGGDGPVDISIEESSLLGKPAWAVKISDRGPGIPPSKRAIVFARYQRLESLSHLKGTGLGLAVVRTLTEKYGGKVEIEDRVPGDYSKGTCVSVKFEKA